MAGVVKLGVYEAAVLKPFAIKNYNGTTYHVNFANEILFIFGALQLSYDIIVAPDGTLGKKQPDGNWTGLMGMAERFEVDVVMYPLVQDTDAPQNTHFSYPYGITDVTFMTNKPEPVLKSMTIIHPFPYSMWIAIAAILITIPIIFYALMNKKVKYQTILFNVFGYLLEQSLTFKAGKHSARILLTGFLLGIMIISNGYKAVLLASLSVPSTTVIRDIAELARASTQGLVTCFYTPGSDLSLYTDSDIASYREIGACIKRHENQHTNTADFYSFKSKKACISSRRGLSFDEKNYYISKDSFSFQLYSFLLSKNFCCAKKFNRLINQLRAVGLDKKFEDEEKFFWQYYTKTFFTEESTPSTASSKILMSDISGAFIVLILGWTLSFLALVGEIFTKKYIARRK